MKQEIISFEFTSFKFKPTKKRIFFSYKAEFKNRRPILFTETIILPRTPNLNGIPRGLFNKILEGLHIVIGISYYKLHFAPKIKLSYSLSKKEAEFWNTLYKNGLGEFLYKNNLNPDRLAKFPFENGVKAVSYRLDQNGKSLVSVSGGKDSIVATELLKEQGFDITAFFVETQRKSDLVDKIIDISKINSLKIRRILDEKTLNGAGYNGHIPVSAIYAFLGILCAVLYKYSYYIVANEHSSNFGNKKYRGEIINHQWSKSSEFENIFQEYVKNFITPNVRYFSLLRPFYEIRIADIFSKYKKYFPYFSSCNKNFTVKKRNKKLWCNQCPKCVFVFTLLSVFLAKKELEIIFGKNLYQDKKLLPLFRDILGFGKMKPLDCVGTFQESRAALYLASRKFKSDLVIKTFLPKTKKLKFSVREIFKANITKNIPSQFRFSGVNNILILGYGREGKSTKKYVEKKYPNLKIDIADVKFGKKYLNDQGDYDLIIKTPGIAKRFVKNNYTTATNIFFSEIKNRGNRVVGITGTKGKSTTAQLLYEILKTAGKNVKIMGNIGDPMLLALLGPVKKDEIFILELSSFQLDDINFSPNISVITNLFADHMDYHLGVENYYNAKKNIINFQNHKDIFVYNPKYKKLVSWAKNSSSKPVPFIRNTPISVSEIPLIGEHNRENIGAAITVAKILSVSDKAIKKAIKNFTGLSHRLEFVGEFSDIKFYDDAISTTPESTIEAIKSLKKVDTIFLGGEDRGYNFSKLAKIIGKYKIKNIVFFPDSGQKIMDSLLSNNFSYKKKLNILRTKSMQKAVKFAFKFTEKGGICLLSCASPSYSLWKNFEEKGNQFQSMVKKLS